MLKRITKFLFPNKETVAQEALRLLNAIPEEQFIQSYFSDGQGACCAIGHYQRLKSKNPNNYDVKNCSDYDVNGGYSTLRTISKKFIHDKYNLSSTSVAEVNNGIDVNGYNEPVIKDRVIHLLNDMVKAGY